MNAPVKRPLLLQSIATESIARCRAILSGEEMTPEQFAMAQWWGGLHKRQQRALFQLAGIPDRFPLRAWLELNEKQRAALVLVVGNFAPKLQAINSALQSLRQESLAVLNVAAGKQQAAA